MSSRWVKLQNIGSCCFMNVDEMLPLLEFLCGRCLHPLKFQWFHTTTKARICHHVNKRELWSISRPYYFSKKSILLQITVELIVCVESEIYMFACFSRKPPSWNVRTETFRLMQTLWAWYFYSESPEMEMWEMFWLCRYVFVLISKILQIETLLVLSELEPLLSYRCTSPCQELHSHSRHGMRLQRGAPLCQRQMFLLCGKVPKRLWAFEQWWDEILKKRLLHILHTSSIDLMVNLYRFLQAVSRRNLQRSNRHEV